MWLFIETLFTINLLLILLPTINKRSKRLISVYKSSALSICLLFFVLLNLHILFLNSYSPFLFFEYFSISTLFVLDNLAIIFCFLTTFLSAICLFLTWKSPKYLSTSYFISIWLLEFCLFHAFSSLNLISFYIFFEITLVPMLLLILIWGSRQRKLHAAFLFFFYTALGSIFLLFGILWLYFLTNTIFLPNLSYLYIDLVNQKILWILFFLGFAAKVPLIPLHTWLPEAHVEAPTPGSIILAGLLLKIGTFGMLKFMFPLLNLATTFFKPLAFTFALLSIYHASLVAIRQLDLKKIIAYSSIAHMGFVILGLFSTNLYGFLGSIFIMLSHGFVASSLFFLVGFVYDRYGTRNILDYSGLVLTCPVFVCSFFFLSLANMSFPGTSNFVGEAFVLFGVTEIDFTTSLLATFSIILTSIYTIWSFNRVSFGELNKSLHGFFDFNKIEFIVFFCFFIFILLFGFKQNLLFHGIDNLPFFYLINR